MPDAQIPLPLIPAHYNHGLFADHYLDEVLPARWAHLNAEARAVLAAVTRLFDAYHSSDNEAQTEHDLVRPILQLLGHTFEVQVPLKTPDGVKVPDYVFYRDPEALNAHKNCTLTDCLPNEGGLAVGDAKYWGRPLDIAIKQKNADALSNKNPAYQIYFYILHSGVAWGILTNGKHWRLYHRDTAHKLDVYYEVDLEELVRAGDVDRFLYFFAFFRRAAFDACPLCLAELLRASVEYAHGVGNTLKSQVYDALRHLAQGFLDYPGNGLVPAPEALAEIYDNSLILLYRLIFILYAEARELLPVRESELYRETYSLLAIKRAVARDLRAGKRLLPTSALLWPRLRQLFQAINMGEPDLHIATFNGGLFDPAKHPFLEQHTVGDAHLQQAIDKLARVDGQFVDYRDLAVRHMGTIYEGLLEFKLVPGGRQSLAASGAEGPAPSPWSVDLLNDKGERKATGSYYTPDYIVKYIVEQTVTPVLWDAVQGCVTDDEIVNAVMCVNVLDPAMGSGHFLVEATECIARFLVDYGIVPPGKTAAEADLAYWKRRVAQSCIYGVDLNPLAVELAKLSLWLITVAKDRPLSFLDHHLRPGNSLVGTRLSALQREGASLPAVARRAKAGPLALKRKKAKLAPVEQTALFTGADFTSRMSIAVSDMWRIEESEAQTVAQVKQQETLYAGLREKLIGKYGRLADLLAARHFGLEVPADLWLPLVDAALGRNLTILPVIRRLLDEAQAIAVRERFFHWELEFPELYFDKFGRPLVDDGGFEAVIGNPPYVRSEGLGPYKPYFQQAYEEVYHGSADLFVYFFAQGLLQARQGGLLSYISSNSWLRANYATPLRRFLRETVTVETLIDIGDNHVFEEAPDVYPAINIVRRALPPTDHTAQSAVFTRGESVARFDTQLIDKMIPVAIFDQDDSGWQLGDNAGRQVFRKLMSVEKTLGEVVGGQIYYGVKTGLNEAFIIDHATRDRLIAGDPSCSFLIRKLVNGEDIRNWYIEDEDRWLILIPSGWTVETFGPVTDESQAWVKFSKRYPTLATHLSPHEKAACRRTDKGEFWWELRPCSYYNEFNKRKIFWPEMGKSPRFALANQGIVCNKTAFMLATDDPCLLAISNSRSIWFIISRLCVPIGERKGMLRYTLSSQFISRLPIPAMSDADRTALGALAMEITELARARYALHQQVRHRLLTDFSPQGTHNPLVKLNTKLTAWWEMDFPALRTELQKVFKRDIALHDRDDAEAWLAARRAEHTHLTTEIITRETELNARVYALFNLTEEEIALIEESTKYRYGEV